jgi:predicted KAP-like P-loop ATPase
MVEIADKPERPIEQKADDFLDRGDFVERLARSLVAPDGRSTGIVIGLTGSWGSGKSSILNLLREHLRLQYPDAILIVNFDPWLVSGRDDLITQFLAQVIGTINSEPKLRDRLKGISKTLAAYGSQLSPIANLIKPGLGAVFKGGFALVEKALSGSKNLIQLRKELEADLRQLGMPIVVMIDELDRVEDEEDRS